MPIVFTVATFAMLAVLLVAERQKWPQKIWIKAATSTAFVAIAISGGAPVGDTSRYAESILVGLALGWIGDVCLAKPGRGWFLGGLIAFLAGHLAYVVAFAAIAPPGTWLRAWMALPLCVSAAALIWLWPHAGKMRGAVLAYVAVITAMVIGAIATALKLTELDGGTPPLAVKILLGATLFYASDLAVARERFVTSSFFNRAWGLPAYYTAQVLIAWSVVA